MIGILPKSLLVDGIYYPINCDFRAALDIFEAYGDYGLSDLNKRLTLLEVIYTPLPTEEKPNPVTNIPPNMDEALSKAVWFLDVGIKNPKEKVHSKTMDYVQDEQLLFSAVNKVVTKDVRELPYLHWWTFYGLCQAVDSESLLSFIIYIRMKRAKGQKLEKHEKTFYDENKHLVDFNSTEDEYKQMVRQLRGE